MTVLEGFVDGAPSRATVVLFAAPPGQYDGTYMIGLEAQSRHPMVLTDDNDELWSDWSEKRTRTVNAFFMDRETAEEVVSAIVFRMVLRDGFVVVEE